MTSDDYALACINEGQRLGITPRGIQIALSVELVETNLTMYANSNDPASLLLPHDKVGSDHMSSGLFQQQPSWGTLADRMDPTASANIFFMVDNGGGVRGLTKIRDGNGNLYDYNNTSNSPGFYAQTVQGSAFPDRYDQRFNDAVALYNRLVGAPVTPPAPADPRLALLQAARPDFNEFPNWCQSSNGSTFNWEDRQGTQVDLFLRHTEENSGYTNALDLSNFLKSTIGSSNPVSYHRVMSKGQNDDGVTVVDCVPLNQAAWAVGNSNMRSINICYADSRVAWTRQEWIDNLGRCIDVAGYLTVKDWIEAGGVGAPPVCAGPGYGLNPPVVSDHRYCTDWLKDGNTHVDVGDNYPWDLDEQAVAKYWAIANAQPAPDPVPAPVPVPVPPPVIVPPAPVPAPVPTPIPVPLKPSDEAGQISEIWDHEFGESPVSPALISDPPAVGPVTVAPTEGSVKPMVNKARMELVAGAPVVVAVKPGPVTWQDDVKKYWHLAIAVIGMILVGVNELTPLITDPTMKSYVTIVITALTAVGVFLKNNENWVDSELNPPTTS